jgi:ribonuclease R
VRVQVSRVDLDGRKIDFRLVREGEDLTTRAMKDKGVGAGGAPVKASAKRNARGGGKSAEVVPLPVERAEGAQSAMQAFKSAVKKAANKMKGRKPRRG